MAKRFIVKPGYERAEVVTSKPLSGRADGRFVLSQCSQRELKYLAEVIHYEGVEIQDDVGEER